MAIAVEVGDPRGAGVAVYERLVVAKLRRIRSLRLLRIARVARVARRAGGALRAANERECRNEKAEQVVGRHAPCRPRIAGGCVQKTETEAPVAIEGPPVRWL